MILLDKVHDSNILLSFGVSKIGCKSSWTDFEDAINCWRNMQNVLQSLHIRDTYAGLYTIGIPSLDHRNFKFVFNIVKYMKSSKRNIKHMYSVSLWWGQFSCSGHPMQPQSVWTRA